MALQTVFRNKPKLFSTIFSVSLLKFTLDTARPVHRDRLSQCLFVRVGWLSDWQISERLHCGLAIMLYPLDNRKVHSPFPLTHATPHPLFHLLEVLLDFALQRESSELVDLSRKLNWLRKHILKPHWRKSREWGLQPTPSTRLKQSTLAQQEHASREHVRRDSDKRTEEANRVSERRQGEKTAQSDNAERGELTTTSTAFIKRAYHGCHSHRHAAYQTTQRQ